MSMKPALHIEIGSISATNVSGLLIARAQTRTQEIAVRLALGSGRFRLMRQMLTESLLLALVAGFAGFLLALWTIKALPALLPPFPVRPFPEFYLDARMIAFSAALSLIFYPNQGTGCA
jgi:ABC-type antimicrobial peptide transport system permease subunit